MGLPPLPSETWHHIGQFLSCHDRGVLLRACGPWRAAMLTYPGPAHLCLSESGASLEMAVWALRDGAPAQGVFDSAAARDCRRLLEIAITAVSCGKISSCSMLCAAAAAGQIFALDWMRLHWRLVLDAEQWHAAAAAAATAGGVSTVRWFLRSVGLSHQIYDTVLRAAAASGHTDVLDLLPGGIDNERALLTGAANGQRAVVQWALARNAPLTWAMLYAARQPDMGVLEELVRHGAPIKGINNAAARGDLPMMQWLRARGCAFDHATMSAAIRSGSIPAAEWLRAQGCEWGLFGADSALSAGMYEWLRRAGCPWNDYLTASAVAAGGAAAVAWLRESGLTKKSAYLEGCVLRQDWELLAALIAADF